MCFPLLFLPWSSINMEQDCRVVENQYDLMTKKQIEIVQLLISFPSLLDHRFQVDKFLFWFYWFFFSPPSLLHQKLKLIWRIITVIYKKKSVIVCLTISNIYIFLICTYCRLIFHILLFFSFDWQEKKDLEIDITIIYDNQIIISLQPSSFLHCIWVSDVQDLNQNMSQIWSPTSAGFPHRNVLHIRS